MRKLSLAIVVAALAGCCTFPLPPLPHPEPLDLEPDVQIQHLVASDEANDHSFGVRVKFYEWTKYEHVVQEVHLPGGATLVEVFRTPNGRLERCQTDHHRANWGSDHPYTGTYVRRMFLYPGRVEGVDWTSKGFAQLPENEDGSVTTTIGPNFNASYQEDHETQGRVVEADRSAGFWWTIIYENGKVRVVIPDLHEYSPEEVEDDTDEDLSVPLSRDGEAS